MQNVYLITGASSDVGCALIRRLADHDSQALIVAQGAGDLNRLAELCREFPGRIRTYDVDLTDENALNAFIADVQASCPAPTHLVHLPALRVINTKFKKFDEERFELDLSVQVRSAVKLCKTFVPLMAKAKRGRVLFMLTSYLIGVPPKNTAAYIMAKSALGGLAKSLAADYAPFGVTVNCVAPSMMETRFLADTSDLIVQASAEANPMGRNARVEDVVPAMEFLLGDEAGFITGVTLPITGGSAF
ncbi:epimerase [Gemmiger sp. An120]|uniref:SDR family NAD(P)-dependent oxidoreductase n=1 Tax=Gemmiger TaxID=204475 RepID=UPI000B38E905|nr:MULTISPECIES: SDR family oxidoreductase [Gemmiger]MBM6914734.1 SDR family oxidoreductase [Gemmiger formicilis]OUQ44229.1 epimerase [Gemmiger sp. An120]HIX32950.1 SDR family oxidoreductase [Candidatus Gemmiger avium]